MMKRTVSLLLAVLLVLLCSFSYADKARSIATQEDENRHIIHLRRHIGSTALHGTGNYLKVRSQARINASVLGHLEQKDTFELLEIQNGLALITVLAAAPTSPNSWAGLTGWVDCRYIDCGCTDEVYRMPAGDTGWKKDYYDFICSSELLGDDYLYSYIFVDQDNIPEVAIQTESEAGGSIILTYHDGLVDCLQTARLGFSYIPYGNLLNNCDGHMGQYYDFVFSIQNGRWVLVGTGEYGDDFDEHGYELDNGHMSEDNEWIYPNYSWNGHVTDYDGYYSQLGTLYDETRAIYPQGMDAWELWEVFQNSLLN